VKEFVPAFIRACTCIVTVTNYFYMRILFASDHAGFDLKNTLVEHVRSLGGYEVVDMGAHTYDAQDDYPACIAPAARAVSEDPQGTRAIILGGSGQGEAIVANRFSGVRAVVYNGESKGALRNEVDEIQLSREHNDANVLSLGARFLDAYEAKNAVTRWLSIPFSNDARHVRRIADIDRVCATENTTSHL
jgi:ribose 5-phosphate isomerase B